MEQSLIKNFFKPADPNAPRRIHTLQPLVHVPKAKRPVGRPRKRPPMPIEETPFEETLVEDHPVQLTSKRIRASYTMKKQEVVAYAKKHTLYQACKHFGLSKGTVWVSLELSNSLPIKWCREKAVLSPRERNRACAVGVRAL